MTTGVLSDSTVTATAGDTNTLAAWLAGITVSGTNKTLSGIWTAAAYIPTSSIVPTNGMYLPSANTLGWAVNTTAKLSLDATALFPATDGDLALGTAANGFSSVSFASGAVVRFDSGDMTLTHSTNLLTLAGGAFTVSGTATITGTLAVGSNASTTTTEALNGASGSYRSLYYRTANINRWGLRATDDAESGDNAGSDFLLAAYDDAGSYTTGILQARRASGLFGDGKGYIANLAPFQQQVPRGTYPAGVIGNDRAWGTASDEQVEVTLGTDPIATVSGSSTLTITWPGACVALGPIGNGDYEVWVNITGATALAGITPTGWLKVQSRPTTDTFTVNWTSTAASTTTGGGSAVVIRPMFNTTTDKIYSVVTSAARGFPIQRASLFTHNPEFMTSSTIAQSQQNWSFYTGPNDPTGVGRWGAVHHEIDLTNRGLDAGYQPFLYTADNPTIGFWAGAWNNVSVFAPGGGTATNWNTIYSIFSNFGDTAGVYTGYSVQPMALVAASADPTSQGGVGVDLFGSYLLVLLDGFATSVGTSTITVTAYMPAMGEMVNGDTVYVPKIYTLNGVTFGAASYTVANVNTTTGTFEITGSGTAGSSGSGGGSGQAVVFERLNPQSPIQFWGGFEYGIRTKYAQFASGYLIDTQPGAGIRWDNGTGEATIQASGTGATVDLTVTASTIDLDGTVLVSTGDLGVGTASPTARLHVVKNTTAASGNTNLVYIDGLQSVADTGEIRGIYVTNAYTGTSGNTLAALYGTLLDPANASTGTVTNLAAVRAVPANTSSGTVTNMYGGSIIPQNTSTGTVTNQYGLFVRNDNSNAGGTVTTAYGVYIAAPSNAGTMPTKWGLYQADTGSKNVLFGRTLIGGTTDDGSTALQSNGSIKATEYFLRSIGNALTATGTTRADALQLAKETNRLTTVASGTGVILPVGVIGMRIRIYQNGANPVKVYASASETIDGTAGSAGVTLTNALRCEYEFVAANTWISAQMGVVSA